MGWEDSGIDDLCCFARKGKGHLDGWYQLLLIERLIFTGLFQSRGNLSPPSLSLDHCFSVLLAPAWAFGSSIARDQQGPPSPICDVMAAIWGNGGQGGQFPLEQWFYEMPPVTRWWTVATVATSVLVHCEIISAFQLFYSFRLVFLKSQVRRHKL